ncbi:MAG: hypothetical protein M3004_01980, partial [Bacteroidota bacterium]|nr:hypothetical protein [Bacteroidota bacterium]
NQVGFDNQTNVGRGGLIIVPYLDLNNNGKHDADEPKVSGLKLRINGGRVIPNKKDTSISIVGLEAYTNYFLELYRGSFDNVSWQIRKKTMNISIEPNHFRLVEVPVVVQGEVSGIVNKQANQIETGIGRIIVNIYNAKDSVIVTKILSESDGYFSFSGLAPGNYIATIDKEQLLTLHMLSSPPLSFKIKQGRDGDVVEGLKFVIQPIVPEQKKYLNKSSEIKM